MKKYDKVEEKIEAKVEPKKENNLVFYIVAFIALVMFVTGFISLKMGDIDEEYSNMCVEKLVADYWEIYSWFHFIAFHDMDGTIWLEWYYKTWWYAIDCYPKDKDNIEIKIDPYNNSVDLKEWEVFYEEDIPDKDFFDSLDSILNE